MYFLFMPVFYYILSLLAFFSYLITVAVSAALGTSAFPCEQLWICFAKLEHHAELKEEKQFDRN